MRRSWSRLVLSALAVGALVTGVATTAGAAPAGPASTPGGGDGSQPLPGYTIDNPTLPPAQVGGRPTRVLQGTYRHAGYMVEVPPNWNGQLVTWAHGYAGEGFVLSVSPPAFGLRQKLLDQGFAWAASSYYQNGYDVRAGVLSTHDLAVHFTDLVRAPRRVYITGLSMGGHVVGRSIEQYPHFYAGALPMCGVLGDAQLFDFFLDYNVVAQALAGVRQYPVPADYLTTTVPGIQVALGLAGLTPTGPDTTNDKGKQLRAITINRSGGPRPGADAAFAVWKDFLFGIAVNPDDGGDLAHNAGRISQNVLTRYRPAGPFPINQRVQRLAPQDLRSRLTLALTQIPKITGRPSVPVVSLHGLGDMFVPFSMEQIYANEARFAGRSGLVVQRAIRSAQHCEFSPNEVGKAWDDLVRWVNAGGARAPWARPAGDAVADPRQVATPTFGCRFSDPTAYATGTRPLYAPCPTS